MSCEGKTWNVRSAGVLIEGFDQETVVGNFSETFKITEEKATPYLKKGKLIRKGLNEVEATNYKTQLEKLGLAISIEDSTAGENAAVVEPAKPVTNTATNTAIPGLVPTGLEDSAATRNSASLDSTSQPSLSTSAPSFSCPKCMLGQEKTDQCKGCGIIFEKFAQRNHRDNNSRDVIRSNPRNNVATIEDDNDIPVAAIGAAVAAAIVCAFIWKFFALQFEKEFVWIAWAVGGAIGGAAVAMGGRGAAMGGICACLVVGSILLGKHMYVSAYLSEAIAFVEEVEEGGWIEIANDRFAPEREAYAVIDKDSDSIKRFMIDYQYTDATKVTLVSDDDFDYFKNDIEPWLLMEAEENSDGYDNQLPPEFAAAMDAVAPWKIVIATLSLWDLLFLFFGVGTAFRVVQSGLQEN